VNPETLYAAVVARLKAQVPTVDVHEAQVPDAPTADGSGRVLPYAVVWGSAGWTADQARSITLDADGALTWPCPITVAAGDPIWCLRAAHAVRTALDGFRIDGDVLYEQAGTPPMTRDADPTPPRWYVPFTFRIGPTL